MWQATHEQVFKGLTKESIWAAWADVDSWSKWDLDTDFTRIEGPFQPGTKFLLKPKGGPKVTIQLTEVQPQKAFTDVTKFPLARMYDFHEVEETPDGLKLKSRIWVEGPLSFLWRKIVAEGVAAGVPKQMAALAEYAKARPAP